MIQLYPKGQTTFTNGGIALHPVEAEVTWQIAGRYDLSLSIPKEAAEGIELDYGQILKVSVPPEKVGPINLGTVSYYETNKSTPLYSQIPAMVKVSYSNWQALRSYMAGDKVTYDKKNWQCVTGHGGLSVPPPNGGLWTEISGTRQDSGKTIETLASGTDLMKLKDFNASYYEVATLSGKQGYVKKEDADATGQSESRVIPEFEISEQLFTINTIDKETNAHMIRIEAEHISYQLGRTILNECNVVGVNPATALLFIQGAMEEAYAGGLYTNVTEGTIDADWSWKNAQAAILDPSSGLLQFLAARAVRDNLDVYIIPNGEDDPEYEVRYGVNLKTVKWTGDVSGIVTRVYPIAQREDGTRITLPEKYIESELDVPYIRPEVLDTKLKIGQKIQNSDGTEVELTESDVMSRMREAAQARFDIDRCDQAEVSLELDWVHMPETEEYKPYLVLRNAAPASWVRVNAGPMGVDSVIQLTGYAWDPILKKYKKTTFGDKNTKPTIAGYNMKAGSVTGRALASGAVGSENIRAGAITAREIEANSITAEQIASKIITTQLIAAGAITADEIAANAITATKIAADAITAAHISATAIDAINAKLGTATITNGYIENAYIDFARLKAATAESLIARDAVTDRYFIDKLSVRNAQMVQATVGELVIKTTNNKYYRLDIDEYGAMAPTEVTLTQTEISEGVTSDGHGTIIETDLTVADLSASNLRGINALIDKLTAARIDVDELFARTATINALNAYDISNNSSLLLYVGSNFYEKKSGIAILAAGLEASGGSYVKIKTGGSFLVDSGNFTIDAAGNVSMTGTINAEAGGSIAGWDINATSLTGNKTGIAKTTNDSDVAFWAGSATSANANFRVTQGGNVTLKSLYILDESGNETPVNLQNYGLWKLNYATVKSITVDGTTGSVTITTTAGSYSFNRGSTGTITLSGGWTDNWTKFTVVAKDENDYVVAGPISSGSIGFYETAAEVKAALESSASHTARLTVEDSMYGVDICGMTVDASGVYTLGQTDGWNDGYDTALGYVSMPGAGTGTSFTVTIPNAARTGPENRTFTITKGTPSASGGYAAVSFNNGAVARISLDDWWSGGADSVTVSSITRNSADQRNSDHTYTVYAKATASNGAYLNQNLTVDATAEYNAGWTGAYNTVGLDSTTETTLGYGDTVTVYAQAKSNSGASSKTNVASRKIKAPAAVTISSITRNSNDQHNNNHTISVYAKATASNGAYLNQTLTVDATTEYNGGWSGCYATVGLNSTTATTLDYGASVTVYAQAKASSGASSKTNVASRKITAPAAVTISSITRNGDDQHNSDHTISVYAKATASNGATKNQTLTVNATTEYNGGWSGCYATVGLNSTSATTLGYGESVTVYAQAKASSGASSKTNVASRTITAPADRYNTGKADGIASVTVSSVGQQGTITYSNGNYSVPVNAVASNQASKAATITFAGTSAYNSGWNACLTACGISGGGDVRTGGTYYANLYIMGQSGPSRVGSGYVGVNTVHVNAK